VREGKHTKGGDSELTTNNKIAIAEAELRGATEGHI